jgi:hypothetical protein
MKPFSTPSLVTDTLAAATLGVVSQAHAAVLAGFGFDGSDPARQIANGNRIAPETVAAGVTIDQGFGGGNINSVGSRDRGRLTLASEDIFQNGNARVDTFAADDTALRDNLLAFGVYEQSQDETGAVDPTQNSLQDAVDDDTFFSFTVSPEAGRFLDLDTLSFDYAFFNNNGVPRDLAVFTSVDGFDDAADAVATFESLTRGTVDPGTAADGDATRSGINEDVTVAFGSDFDHLTGPIEIRIYFYDGQFNMNDGSKFGTLDNVVLEGTAAPIPEPAAALSGLLGLSLLARRRP